MTVYHQQGVTEVNSQSDKNDHSHCPSPGVGLNIEYKSDLQQ